MQPAIKTKSDEEMIRQGACWDEERAQAIINFAHTFFQPQFVRGTFRLLPWQTDYLRTLYGWRWMDGSRVKRFSNLHIAKKAGKTLIVSLIAFFEIYNSEEPSPYVAAAAASKENASQVFKELRYSIERSPFWDKDPSKSYTKITDHTKHIRVPSLNAEFRSLASQGSRVHGEPCSCVVIDECHAHQNPELFRALRYNTDARKNGLVVCISTAGSDTSHFYHSIYSKSKRILANEEVDPIWHCAVYEADPRSDWESDESQWHAANPSIGISFPVSQFRRELQSAKTSGLGEWLTFQRLKLNLWVKPDETAWLDMADFDRYRLDVDEERLKRCRSVIGLDLSEVGDPSSCSIVFDLGNGEYYIRSHCWVAEDAIQKRNKGTLCRFDEFIEAGCMTETDGNLIDRQKVFNHVLDLANTYGTVQVNLDPQGGNVLGDLIANEGYDTARIVQSFRNYHPIMVEFQRAWKEGRIFHDGSPWLRFCFGNVRIEVNKYNECRPFKRKSVDLIDGAISTLLAFNTAFSSVGTGGGGIEFF